MFRFKESVHELFNWSLRGSQQTCVFVDTAATIERCALIAPFDVRVAATRALSMLAFVSFNIQLGDVYRGYIGMDGTASSLRKDTFRLWLRVALAGHGGVDDSGSICRNNRHVCLLVLFRAAFKSRGKQGCPYD